MLTFDEQEHRYFWEGQPVPGVTSVLSPLIDLSFVDPDVLQAAAAFGTAVHKACELDDLGQLDETALDENLRPYLEGWRKFSADFQVQWRLIEHQVFHKTLRYAGTLDRFGLIKAPRWTRHEEAVVDIKSSVALYPAVGPQLAAYQRATPEASLLTKRLAVQLRDDGTYRHEFYSDPADFAVFSSLNTLSQWCGKHRITPKFQESNHV